MRYTYPEIAAYFAAGGLVTAVFSGSLAVLAKNATFAEVLATGLIVPTFTWAVQLTASWLLMRAEERQIYWGTLSRVCLIGSIALLPAGIFNLLHGSPLLWPSAMNVLASVGIMASEMFRRCDTHKISSWWPASWTATICLNMAIFVFASRHWWSSGG